MAAVSALHLLGFFDAAVKENGRKMVVRFVRTRLLEVLRTGKPLYTVVFEK